MKVLAETGVMVYKPRSTKGLPATRSWRRQEASSLRAFRHLLTP